MSSPLNWKRQLILAVSLFVLGSFAYWLEYSYKPKKESIEEDSKKLILIKDIPIRSLQLNDGNKQFEFSCLDFASKLCKSGDQSKWEVLKPMKVKADDGNVNSLLSTLSGLSSTETISLQEENPEKRAALLKEYGLDPASRNSNSTKRVYVRTDSGETVVYLGLTHPIGETVFVVVEKTAAGQKPLGQVDDSRVYLVANYFKNNFDHPLTYWREKKILTWGSHEIEFFKLEGTKAKLESERKDGQWTLKVKDETLSGDSENIDSLLTTVTSLTAKEFTSNQKRDALAKRTLSQAKPILTLTLKKAHELITLVVYEKKEKPGSKSDNENTKIYVTISNLDPLYELEFSTKERLDKSIKDLRLAKLITSMERFSVKRLEFAGAPMGSTPLVLSNVDGKWVSEPDKKEVSNTKVQEFLDKISGNRIKDFLKGSVIPIGEQEGLKFTLGDEKNPIKKQLIFWKKEKNLYARDLLQSSRKEAFSIDSAVIDGLPWDRNFFNVAPPSPSPSPTSTNLGKK